MKMLRSTYVRKGILGEKVVKLSKLNVYTSRFGQRTLPIWYIVVIIIMI